MKLKLKYPHNIFLLTLCCCYIYQHLSNFHPRSTVSSWFSFSHVVLALFVFEQLFIMWEEFKIDIPRESIDQIRRPRSDLRNDLSWINSIHCLYLCLLHLKTNTHNTIFLDIHVHVYDFLFNISRKIPELCSSFPLDLFWKNQTEPNFIIRCFQCLV